jgi:hypothetical protein
VAGVLLNRGPCRAISAVIHGSIFFPLKT